VQVELGGLRGQGQPQAALIQYFLPSHLLAAAAAAAIQQACKRTLWLAALEAVQQTDATVVQAILHRQARHRGTTVAMGIRQTLTTAAAVVARARLA
jgi:hypothetical protein